VCDRATLAEREVNAANAVGLVLAVVVTVFLVIALIYPEKF
jgi:K+-transporting ATPase KdpF subunit